MAAHRAEDASGGGQLVGRGRDLAALLSRLATARLVCLTGLPGVGRTRLALEAVGQLRREVVWESGAGYEPEMLAGVGARLRHRFAGRSGPLLVLDDWDHLGGAGTALVASLLLDLPELTVLVVAERPCHLRGETVMVLRPLDASVPDGADRPSEALELLRAVLGDAAVDRDPDGAARLCRRFGGVPGPLVEAARAWTAADGDADGIGPGERQLAAAARSYARCSRVEQLLWRRLAVFEDGFRREAAPEVCGGGPLPATEVLGILDRIAPHALIQDPHSGRYHLPPAQLAVSKRELELSGERWAAVLAHRRWALGVARQAAEWWTAGRQEEAAALARRELPGLRAAMDPETSPLSPRAEAATALDVVVHLWFLWTACGHTAEGRTLLRHALALHQAPPPARALWLAAWLELDLGAPERADPLLTAAWAEAVRAGDGHCLGLLAQLRGAAALWQGRTEAAAVEFRTALELAGDTSDFGPGPAQIRAALALALVRTDPEAALETAQPGPAHPGAARDGWAEAWARYARAEVLRWEGDADSAQVLARKALRTFLAYGSPIGGRCAGELLADATALSGDGLLAARLLGAVDAFHEIPLPRSPYLAPVRRRAEALLDGLLPPARRAEAYACGARTGLAALLAAQGETRSVPA
ncbi:ATP-binding protein [Streptomyces sp. NPDC057694]|uniref:ATP-binding protein n=1 Tax=Streptomyces sp. NPDC057694 TaxID=3346216 RepID=UPI0036B8C631